MTSIFVLFFDRSAVLVQTYKAGEKEEETWFLFNWLDILILWAYVDRDIY